MSSLRCAFGLPSGRRCRLSCRGTASLCPLHHPSSPYVYPPTVPATAHFTNQDVAALHGPDPTKIIAVLTKLQNITKPEHGDAILSMNLLERIIQLLDERFGEPVRFRAAWVLTNLAALEDNNGCFAIVDCGGLPPLFAAAKSLDDNLCFQAIWCLSNLAGSDPVIRDEMASMWPCLPRIAALNLVAKDEAARLFMNLANHLSVEHAAAALVEFLPLLEHEDVAFAPGTKRAILNTLEVLWKRYGAACLRTAFDSCLTVSLLLSLTEKSVNAPIRNKTLEIVSEILASDAHDLAHRFLDAGLVDLLKRLLEDERFEKREILFMLSNVVVEDVSAVLECDGLLTAVATFLKWKHPECEDAIWVFANLLKKGTPTQVVALHRLVPHLHVRIQALMVTEGHDASQNLLVDALDNFLQKGGEDAVRAMLLTPVALVAAEGCADTEASAAATRLLNWWISQHCR